MKVEQFIGLSLSEKATDWTSEGNHGSTFCCVDIKFRFQKSQSVKRISQPSIQCVTWIKELMIDLTTYFQFTQKLRIRGAISPLPHIPTYLEQE
jgi:hypothetical protein